MAGRFYPAEPRELHALVNALLGSVVADHEPIPKAIIAPHAGYIYSGAVAAAAYARLRRAHGHIRRVVVLGTAHRLAVRGLAASGADWFETPLGNVAVDHDAVEQALTLPQVELNEEAHDQEHSIEVQLPFLQETLGEFKLVPMVVGRAEPAEVARVLCLLWDGPETLIVVSSDLSHYHDYQTARRLDAETSRSIERLRPQDLRDEQACGRNAIAGLLAAAADKGLAARTLELKNSGDTAGSRDQVVGYGAWMLEMPRSAGSPAFSETERKRLLSLARESIRHGLEHGSPIVVSPADVPPALRIRGAVFVTLRVDDELRGCVGSIRAHRTLAEDVAQNAFASAFRDSRFPPVSWDEIDELEIHISVLSEPEELRVRTEEELLRRLRPGIDGLIIEEGERRGTLLPSMWETIQSPGDFLACLKKKAGLPESYWSDSLLFRRFTAESF